MILLEVNNRIVEDTLRLKIRNALDNPGSKPEAVGVSLADFDGVQYRVANPGGSDRTKINVSIAIKFFRELQSHGANELLKRVYGDLLQTPAEENFDVTLQIDLNKIPSNWEELVTKIGLLKRHCFAAVFERYFEFQEKEEEGHKAAIIHYRFDC
jgi:actin related protein 2/3 complex subunit 2